MVSNTSRFIARTMEDAFIKCLEVKTFVAFSMLAAGLTAEAGWNIGVEYHHSPGNISITYLPVRGNVGETAETRPDLAISINLNFILQDSKPPTSELPNAKTPGSQRPE